MDRRGDALAVVLVCAAVATLGWGLWTLAAPFSLAHPPPLSLSPLKLPEYTARTVLRMLAAMAGSLLFTVIYATAAAHSRGAERALMPLLDVLQSVPVLGYLSFTVTAFLALLPGRTLGPECAAIFAIFTSQAWNMAFSFYQSLRTVPLDLQEVSRGLRQSAWQRFWRLEVPFAVPGLVWNMMMSMSGGWFFVVASEAIAVGGTQVALPGIGSYVALAIQRRDLPAVGWAIAAMTVAILLYDQLLFRPLVAWADRFRVEQSVAAPPPRSWALEWLRSAPGLRRLRLALATLVRRATRARMELPALPRLRGSLRGLLPAWVGEWRWTVLLAAGAAYLLWRLAPVVAASVSLADAIRVAREGGLTLLRVAALTALAAAIWVPAGIAIGLRPALTRWVQPVAQFLAAFPANLFFPVAVYAILRYRLDPRLWLCPLMILGTQWYILFNVIAGAGAFPGELREVAQGFRVRCGRWWRWVMLPGVFPYFVTGAITASGGAWNASIVSETARWGSERLTAGGLGAYIAERTDAGDLPHIALGVACMAALVVAMNRLLWRPLYRYAQLRTRLD
ncbi:MAG TPA: ABC transporter permease subunit [Steroidobacteraceae bacterium]|nr:ABC transporter permease subunit [Steroidobacteraceae bacterium]